MAGALDLRARSALVVMELTDALLLTLIPVPQLVALIQSFVAPFDVRVTTRPVHPTAVGVKWQWLSDLCLIDDGEWAVGVNSHAGQYLKFNLLDGRVYTLCGSESSDTCVSSRGAQSTFDAPTAICCDPLRPAGDSFYLADTKTVRHYDATADIVSLVAGGAECGDLDGVGSEARFDVAIALAVTSDGRYLYVGDFHNCKIRRVEIATQIVVTVAEDVAINKPPLCWDRAVSTTPDTALYLLVPPDANHLFEDPVIKRIDLLNPSLTKTYTLPEHHVLSIVSTVTGLIVFSCLRTFGIFVFDPTTATTAAAVDPHNLRLTTPPERLIGICTGQHDCTDGDISTAAFSQPSLLVLDSNARCLYVCDRGSSADNIRRVTAPPHLFALPFCCEND